MAGNSVLGAGGGGTGTGFTLGPATNTFNGANLDAARAARNAYAAANPDWVAEYDANPILMVRLTYGSTVRYESRIGGNWFNITAVIRGPAGSKGDQGIPGPADRETIEDVVAAFLRAGMNVTLNYDDANDRLTISSAASGGEGGGGTVTVVLPDGSVTIAKLAPDVIAIHTALETALGLANTRLNHLERRGGASLQLYHLGNGSEQYTQAEFVALGGQNLTITGHILEAALIPNGSYFLRIHDGMGGQIIKDMDAVGISHLQVFQNVAGVLTERASGDDVVAGLVLFTFQITAVEMDSIFTNSANQALESAYVEFDVEVGGVREDNVLATFYQHLVGKGVTPEEALEIHRNGQGVALAREEANEAKRLAQAAAEAVPDGVPDAPDKGAQAMFYGLAVPANTDPGPRTWSPAPTGPGQSGATESQVAAIEANAAAKWPGLPSVTPFEISHDTGAFTMRVTLDRVDGTFPAGAHMRIHERLRNGVLVPAVENDFNTPAVLAFTEDQTADFIRQSRNHVARAELRVYDDDQAINLLATLPIDIPVVISGKWRTLAGSSPYTIRLTDDEFMVIVNKTSENVDFETTIPRLRLGQVSKIFGIAENRPEGSASNWKYYGVTGSIDSTGTRLTIDESADDSTSLPLYTISAVLAR